MIKIKVVKIQNLSFMMSLGTTDSVMPCRRLHHRAVRCVSTVEEGEWIFFLVLDMRPAAEGACEDGDTGARQHPARIHALGIDATGTSNRVVGASPVFSADCCIAPRLKRASDVF